jgi:hypothetical protein
MHRIGTLHSYELTSKDDGSPNQKPSIADRFPLQGADKPMKSPSESIMCVSFKCM